MRKIPQPSSSGSHILYPVRGNVEFKQLERKHHLLEKKKKNQRIWTQEDFGLNTSLAMG